MNVKDLKEYAPTIGINPKSLKKQQLIDLISEKLGYASELYDVPSKKGYICFKKVWETKSEENIYIALLRCKDNFMIVKGSSASGAKGFGKGGPKMTYKLKML